MRPGDVNMLELVVLLPGTSSRGYLRKGEG